MEKDNTNRKYPPGALSGQDSGYITGAGPQSQNANAPATNHIANLLDFSTEESIKESSANLTPIPVKQKVNLPPADSLPPNDLSFDGRLWSSRSNDWGGGEVSFHATNVASSPMIPLKRPSSPMIPITGSQIEIGGSPEDKGKQRATNSDAEGPLSPLKTSTSSPSISVSSSPLPALPSPSPFTVWTDSLWGSDWNRQFQDNLNKPDNDRTKWTRLHELSEDFVTVAATYGSVIIVQHEKKISGRVSTDKADLNAKPADVGGIAGGEKFEQEGIIYKFAVDHRGIYGGRDEWAMKAAKLELKALRCIEWAEVEGLRYPLIALIQFNGYTLIAMSKIPLDNGETSTLVYGSNDAGKTFAAGDEKSYKMIASLGQSLGLRGVQLRKQPNSDRPHYGPIDMEIHYANGVYYVVDTARLMPPDPLRLNSNMKDIKASFAFHLRPRLLQTLKEKNITLISEIFSPFFSEIVNVDSREKLEAEHRRIVGEFIGGTTMNTLLSFARIPETLKDLFDDVEEPSTFSILPDISVILFNLHDYGLNYHHIGYVVSKANSFINSMNGEEKVAILKALSRALVVEALARTLKNKVWAALRAAGSATEYFSFTARKAAVFGCLDQLFLGSMKEEKMKEEQGKSDQKKAWKSLGMMANVECFPDVLSHINIDNLLDELTETDWRAFWNRFSVLSGVVLSSRITSTSKDDRFFNADIIEFRPRVSTLGVLELSAVLSMTYDIETSAASTAKNRSPAEAKFITDQCRKVLEAGRRYIINAPLVSQRFCEAIRSTKSIFYFYSALYYQSFGNRDDFKRAIRFYEQAADRFQHVEAAFNLAEMYYQGKHVEKDLAASLKYCEVATTEIENGSKYLPGLLLLAQLKKELNSPDDAQTIIGELLNLVDAHKNTAGSPGGQNWKSKSSYEKLLSEDLKECEMRAHYILGGIYNPDHPKEACEHYMRSHILGYKKAEFAYFDMIERLRVDNRDLGIEFFEELYFQKKLTPAAYFIGDRSERLGLKKANKEEAMQFYENAAFYFDIAMKAEYACGYFRLGRFYKDGVVICNQPDPNRALEYFQIAVSLGGAMSKEAEEAMKKMNVS